MIQTKKQNIRGGNRGGRDQFKWEEVRSMNYRERENYVGVTEKLGYLDKGGRWKKRDWFYKPKEEESFDPEVIKEEIRQKQEEDERRLAIKLGLIKPDEFQQGELSLQEQRRVNSNSPIFPLTFSKETL